MADPKKGIALVFGAPKGASAPAGPAPEAEHQDLADLAAVAFPGVKVDVAALKELIHTCMEEGYDE